MTQIDKIAKALLAGRESVLIKLEAAERFAKEICEEMQPDFDAQSYDGLADRVYPLWQSHRLDDVVFVHAVELRDFGYEADPSHIDDELPKFTGEGDTGELSYTLAFVDRFAGRLTFRGHLKGSSSEMAMSVIFQLSILAFRDQGFLGFSGETLAEGYAFELEERHKQAFFCYFSAFESHLEVCRESYNSAIPEEDHIVAIERLPEKFRRLVAVRLPGGLELKDVKFWGDLKNMLTRLEALRNAVAHNRRHAPVTRTDVADAFTLFSVTVPLLLSVQPDEEQILAYYGLSLPKSASELRRESA